MSIVKLKSTNEKFSWVISKNPETGMQIRSVRKGNLFSWFNSKSEYCAYFKDAQNDISYKSSPDEEYEYLNVSRYVSPFSYINILDNLFSSLIKKENEYDKNGFENEVILGSIQIKNLRYIEIFNRYFSNTISIEQKEIAKNTYEIVIRTKLSIRVLLNFTALFLLFVMIKGEDYFYLESALVGKYIQYLEVIDAPYFIKYVFKVNLLREYKDFEKYKSILEKGNDKIELQFGDNALHREKFVFNNFEKSKHVIDIGCGEGKYGIKLVAKLEKTDFNYIAIDIDKTARRRIYWKSKSRGLKNIKIFKHFYNMDIYQHDLFQNWTGNCQILLIEVIEHMEKNEAELLLDTIKERIVNENTLLITTPNKDFNKNYFSDIDEIRHEDHKFELTMEEFRIFINTIFNHKEFHQEYSNIGDSVNGITPTQAVKITRRAK